MSIRTLAGELELEAVVQAVTDAVDATERRAIRRVFLQLD